jgi:hypothetical protein
MGHNRVHFTPEMDKALLALRGRLAATALPDRLGVAPSVIYRRLRELGQPVRPCNRKPRKQ